MWYSKSLPLLLSLAFLYVFQVESWGLRTSPKKFDYDIVIVGAGASGMFAAGTAASFGCKTLLIDKYDIHDVNGRTNSERNESDTLFYLGGDCSNAACVPSKAVRCAAQIAHLSSISSPPSSDKLISSNESVTTPHLPQQYPFPNKDDNFLSIARKHARQTVNIVRERERPDRVASSSHNLDIIFASQTSFDNPHQLTLQHPYLYNRTFAGFLEPHSNPNNTNHSYHTNGLQITAKKFILCTGAGPSIPPTLKDSAKQVGLPIHTYRTLFRPNDDDDDDDDSGCGIMSHDFWNMTNTNANGNKTKKRIVIAGGGPTACEIAQSLARLLQTRQDKENVDITMIAPSLLPSEDISARAAAAKMLCREGVKMILRRKVIRISIEENDRDDNEVEDKILILDNDSHVPVDIFICATGRDPGPNLSELQLQHVGVDWSYNEGVLVKNNLQSVSTKHVYAAGDCASAVPKRDRKAAHAGWTGYHSVQSAILPWFLRPRFSDCVHVAVPRVTFLDPEIASIGMTRAECIRKFGSHNNNNNNNNNGGGFQYLKVAEQNTDRADMDSLARRSTEDGFIELRVSSNQGTILGATVCSPAASEIINELGVAMVNRLTCRDIARCIHAYPSHGYLMHRVALSLALNNVWGMLSACGPVGRLVGSVGRHVQGACKAVRRGISSIIMKTKSHTKALRYWEALGAEKAIETIGQEGLSDISYLEAFQDDELCAAIENHVNGSDTSREFVDEVAIDFMNWLKSKPKK